jgi:hypothetical protein
MVMIIDDLIDLIPMGFGIRREYSKEIDKEIIIITKHSRMVCVELTNVEKQMPTEEYFERVVKPAITALNR